MEEVAAITAVLHEIETLLKLVAWWGNQSFLSAVLWCVICGFVTVELPNQEPG